MLTEQQIEVMVMKKYPKTDKEKRGCQQEKARLKALRDFYRERLRAEAYTAPTLN